MDNNILLELSHQIELHSVEGIGESFRKGINPNDSYQGKSLFDFLISMYKRSPGFKDCVKEFVKNGLEYDDSSLLAVLTNDVAMLEKELDNSGELISKKFILDCAYTPLFEVSLLHICAEFNHTQCAKILIKHGADINFKAGADKYGFGGQTPIFHTVNQNQNNSAEMMDLLLLHKADLTYTVKGIIWGKNYPWETFIPAVNPISYAMIGMLPQMHRNEKTISQVVSKLIKHAFGIEYTPGNIPNKYLST